MTNLTEQELADDVARIAELEKKTLPDGVMDAQSLGYNIFMFREESYTMASIIRQLWAEREANQAVMVKARDALHNWTSVCPTDWYDTRTAKRTDEPKPVADARKALAELNKALGDTNDK